MEINTTSLPTLFIAIFLPFMFGCDAIEVQGDGTPNNPTSVIEYLAENTKIIEPELILKDFKEGKTTTKVIVTISEPAGSELDKDFKDPAFRKELQETVWSAQNQVISHLDPKRVQITHRFVYIFGFSAQVNLDGLRELTEIDEVVAIEKDRVVKAHDGKKDQPHLY